eukprot:GHVL01004370.1.p3 GENE.GHVL01004370.1~~GHVL01004370.1.p3  ORF type:complete len:138 (+),score=11.06 GHVL01004370.1:118-531(+)
MYPPARSPLTQAFAVPSKALKVLEFVAKFEVVRVYPPWLVTVVAFAKRSEGGCSETTANLFMKVPEESKSSPVVRSYVTMFAATSATLSVSTKTFEPENLSRSPTSVFEVLMSCCAVTLPPTVIFEVATRLVVAFWN